MLSLLNQQTLYPSYATGSESTTFEVDTVKRSRSLSRMNGKLGPRARCLRARGMEVAPDLESSDRSSLDFKLNSSEFAYLSE